MRHITITVLIKYKESPFWKQKRAVCISDRHIQISFVTIALATPLTRNKLRTNKVTQDMILQKRFNLLNSCKRYDNYRS